MREEYLQIASVLAQHADVLLCETMSSIDEARASAEASRCYDRPVWISVCVGKYDEKVRPRVAPCAPLAPHGPRGTAIVFRLLLCAPRCGSLVLVT